MSSSLARKLRYIGSKTNNGSVIGEEGKWEGKSICDEMVSKGHENVEEEETCFFFSFVKSKIQKTKHIYVLKLFEVYFKNRLRSTSFSERFL